MLPSQKARTEFAQWLRDEIPLRQDVQYAISVGSIPSSAEGEEETVGAAYVHISKFAFDEDCGLTGNVELGKTETLLQLIVANGFLSSDEPIRVRWPRADPCQHVLPSSQLTLQHVTSKGAIRRLRGHEPSRGWYPLLLERPGKDSHLVGPPCLHSESRAARAQGSFLSWRVSQAQFWFLISV